MKKEKKLKSSQEETRYVDRKKDNMTAAPVLEIVQTRRLWNSISQIPKQKIVNLKFYVH